MRTFLIVGFFYGWLLIPYLSFGQKPKAFTHEVVAFTGETEKWFNTIKTRQHRQISLNTLRSLSGYLQAGRFSPAQAELIYTTSNFILRRNLRPYPDYYRYLNSLVALVESNVNNENLTTWLVASHVMLQKMAGIQPFIELVSITPDFLRKGILFQSRIFTWKTEQPSFRFVYDSIFRISLQNVNLICFSRSDSTIIYQTSGQFLPAEKIWLGKGGKITWRRAGLSPDQVYAVLQNYRINLSTSLVEAENAEFYHFGYFRSPLIGRLTERTLTDALKPDQTGFPRFEADIPVIYIPEIFPEMDFSGKFIISGNRIIGKGHDDHPAMIIIKRLDKSSGRKTDFLTAKADEFLIFPDKISADLASINIMLSDDSITHPGIQFRYYHPRREVILLRTRKGLEESPFLSSYHGLEIRSQAMVWNLNEEVIRWGAFPGPATRSQAGFLSLNFFSDEHFMQLRGIDRKHPLIWLDEYMRITGTNRFTIAQLATFMKFPPEQVENQVIRLASEGFVTYSPGLRTGWINPKVQHYLNAQRKLSDFDQIGFLSQVTGRFNAEMDLNNYRLSIYGIPAITLSELHNVQIIPNHQQITVGLDRNFLFDGIVTAGLFDFQSSASEFRYGNFSIVLPEIDTLRFRVLTGNLTQRQPPQLREVKTPITAIGGEIRIDHPQNKSGHIDLAGYPAFTSFNESMIFYDHHPEFGKAYDRSRFYYVVRPFTIHDMDFILADSLTFNGYLVSGGILPDPLEHPLEVMSDFSLGFQITTPQNGLPVYDGRGTFRQNILLSYEGLLGKGQLFVGHLEFSGENFIFFPDSLKAFQISLSSDWTHTGIACYPAANGEQLEIVWMPLKDSLMVSTTAKALQLFRKQAFLNGKLWITSDRMTGSGSLVFFQATATSEKFRFGCNTVDAYPGSIIIHKPDQPVAVLKADGCAMMVDLDNLYAGFVMPDQQSAVELPLLKFQTTASEFQWNLSHHTIEFHSSATNIRQTFKGDGHSSVDAPVVVLVSKDPLRDSLTFRAIRATYFADRDSLAAEGVDQLKVADVFIFPDDKKLSIGSDSFIYPLHNATIVADTHNRRHLITNALITINSRQAYHASGEYAFFNAVGDVQRVHFNDIRLNPYRVTTAQGKVSPEENFLLSPRFAFNGDILLNARDSLLFFKGAYRIIQDCDTAFSKWVQFEQRIDVRNLVLPVHHQLQEQGDKRLWAGLFHSGEHNKVYPAFLSRRLYYSDSLLFSIHGVLKTRSNGDELIIVPEDSDSPPDEILQPPYMLWNIDQCKITTRGPLTLGQNLGLVELKIYGQTDYSFANDSTWFQLMMTVNFPFLDAAMNIMAEDFTNLSKPPVDIENQLLREGLVSIAGKTETDRFFNEIMLLGQARRMPEAFRRNFIFTDLSMVYHTETRSFLSRGPIGIAMINGVPVFKYFDGHIQVVRRRTGDELNIYLELEAGHWYFFNYRANQMLVLSSRSDFNAAVRNVKPENRQIKGSGKVAVYRYNLAPDAQSKNRFLRSIRQTEIE